MDRQPVRPYSESLRKQLAKLAQQDMYSKRVPRADVVGKRFGRLEVQRPVGHGSHNRLLVLVHCDCGNAKVTLYDALQSGVKSCGCWNEELRPALKKQRQLDELFVKLIHKNRTAKPVDALAPPQSHSNKAPLHDTDSNIDTTAIRTTIAVGNLFGGDDESE